MQYFAPKFSRKRDIRSLKKKTFNSVTTEGGEGHFNGLNVSGTVTQFLDFSFFIIWPSIFIIAYTLVSPKKYFAKKLELYGPGNLLFSTTASATKLR